MNFLKAFKILISYKNIFDSLGLKFWLDGGTLLGAIRDNSFPPSDFDVDIGTYGEYAEKSDIIVNMMRNSGFERIHVKRHPFQGLQISAILDGIPNDIWFYFESDDKRYRVMFDEFLGTVRSFACVYPKNLFNPLGKIDFMDYGIEFNVPNPATTYLDMSYGDWHTDKSNKEFHWQTDYKSMDESFELNPYKNMKRIWVMTDSVKGDVKDGSFFRDKLIEGYKIFPIVIDDKRNLIDGRKRLGAYKELGIPMVEAYVSTTL